VSPPLAPIQITPVAGNQIAIKGSQGLVLTVIDHGRTGSVRSRPRTGWKSGSPEASHEPQGSHRDARRRGDPRLQRLGPPRRVLHAGGEGFLLLDGLIGLYIVAKATERLLATRFPPPPPFVDENADPWEDEPADEDEEVSP
jgi:hypothetical protein